MERQPQVVLIASTVGFSWLAMQAVHELGHIVGVALTDGHIAEVVLHPAAISYTRLTANPHPLLVAWMGPTIGIALPLAALVAARTGKLPGWYIVQFFAGFCLVANGAYLAFGSFGSIGDAGDMLRHGTPLWLLWLFGIATIPTGLWLWNGLGPHFGMGTEGKVNRVAAYVMLVLFTATAGLELILA